MSSSTSRHNLQGEIILDHQGPFTTGDIITGRVVLRSRDKQPIDELQIVLIGYTQVPVREDDFDSERDGDEEESGIAPLCDKAKQLNRRSFLMWPGTRRIFKFRIRFPTRLCEDARHQRGLAEPVDAELPPSFVHGCDMSDWAVRYNLYLSVHHGAFRWLDISHQGRDIDYTPSMPETWLCLRPVEHPAPGLLQAVFPL
jgi:hypothetical protein